MLQRPIQELAQTSEAVLDLSTADRGRRCKIGLKEASHVLNKYCCLVKQIVIPYGKIAVLFV